MVKENAPVRGHNQVSSTSIISRSRKFYKINREIKQLAKLGFKPLDLLIISEIAYKSSIGELYSETDTQIAEGWNCGRETVSISRKRIEESELVKAVKTEHLGGERWIKFYSFDLKKMEEILNSGTVLFGKKDGRKDNSLQSANKVKMELVGKNHKPKKRELVEKNHKACGKNPLELVGKIHTSNTFPYLPIQKSKILGGRKEEEGGLSPTIKLENTEICSTPPTDTQLAELPISSDKNKDTNYESKLKVLKDEMPWAFE